MNRVTIDEITNFGIDEFKNFCSSFMSELGVTTVQLKVENTNKIVGSGYIELGIISYKFVFAFFRNQSIITEHDTNDVRNLASKTLSDKGLILTTGSISRAAKKRGKPKGNYIPIDFMDHIELSKRLEKYT